MPSKSTKQANTARLAGAVKSGKFPKSKAGPAVKSMSKMPMDKLKHFMKVKEFMTMEQKRRLLVGLRKLKEEYTGNIGGETDIANADNFVSENDMDTAERTVIAKTFDTTGDFDSYVNQRRGIEMTQKELLSVSNYKKSKPTQQDKYSVKFETTDAFGNNDTTIIKKLREGNQFCWTAFSKHESAEEEGKPNSEKGDDNGGGDELQEEMPTPSQPSRPNNAPPPQSGEDQTVTVEDPIRVTKSITFVDDTNGANILADFLMKLDI